METIVHPVGSLPRSDRSAEGMMLREDVVQAILARLARGEGVKRIARELGVDRTTVKRWQRRGQWRPRPSRPRPSPLDPYVAFLERRAPEVGWNGAVLDREVCGLGFTGGSLQVAAVSAAPAGPAAVGRRGDGPRRDGARRAGAGRLRAVCGLDRRPAADRASVRLDPRLLAAAVGAGLPA